MYCELPIEDVKMFLLEDTFWIAELEKAMEDGKPPFALLTVPRENKPKKAKPKKAKTTSKAGSKKPGKGMGKAKKKGGATAAGKKPLCHSPPTKKPPPSADKKDKSQATKDYNSNDLIKDDDTIIDSDAEEATSQAEDSGVKDFSLDSDDDPDVFNKSDSQFKTTRKWCYTPDGYHETSYHPHAGSSCSWAALGHNYSHRTFPSTIAGRRAGTLGTFDFCKANCKGPLACFCSGNEAFPGGYACTAQWIERWRDYKII